MTFILIFSCGQNSAEKKLNGKWYETENPKIFWVFSKDKLEFIDEDNAKVEWNATESKIEFIYRTYIWDSLGKKVHTEDKILIEYKLSKNEDTLSGTLTNSYGKHKFGLIRTE
ncbi:hypothetical protein [Algibacter luteus]|uniref:hypothetical protein n=1 Tax=Algibacter luteus TaxID=1178825 RepID=UPI0025961017|nr:hypothetical protein [Algibacter luteus]WJJ96554.1 hypothetical protein O5O44_15175 [Algibacter luteus]